MYYKTIKCVRGGGQSSHLGNKYTMEFYNNEHSRCLKVEDDLLRNKKFKNSVNSNNNIDKDNKKIAIIYVYYNRKNEYFNETNLSFFIRQTILKEDEENSDKYYLFYINNKICEINFPIRKNVEVIYNDNCFDFDVYGQGINYLKQKFIDFNTQFSHILLMNCSVTGPFLNDHSSDWLEQI